MTLVELLTAEAIGGVVITVAIMLVISSFTSAARVSDRVNSTAQGRVLSAQLEQRLNSQVCLYGGEYGINGATMFTGADSIIYASADKLVFFADIGKGGSTSATGSVGFVPYMRYLYFEPGPSTGSGAGRKGTIVDGWRAPSNTAVPFSYSTGTTWVTGDSALDIMGLPTGIDRVPASTTRRMAEGVTADVTGTASQTKLPFFQYWDTDGNVLSTTGETGAVTQSQLNTIGRIRFNFKILAESGNDTAQFNTSNTIDKRTASFNQDIYLRTNPSICG